MKLKPSMDREAHSNVMVTSIGKIKFSRTTTILTKYIRLLHFISWSGGKDSTASVILMKLHLHELVDSGDEVKILFSEVMFDKKNNISGHNPDIIKFMHKTAAIFESWGFSVEFLHSDKDYLDIFYHKLTRSPNPNRVGMTHGFVPSGKCAVKRDCKLKPIEKWKAAHNDIEKIEYVGIAVDEPARLESLHKSPNKKSLLEMYNFTEADAMELCREYDMLSPQYSLNNGKQGRDGCWFCPNAKLCEHEAIYKTSPEAWEKYVSLESEPALAYPKWNCFSKETLHQRDKLIKEGYYQYNFFELNLL